MQRGNGGRDDLFGFGDPFSAFGNFGRQGSLISSVFGGRDPFDDPFFTNPFGSMPRPSMFGPSMFGPSMFGSSMFGPPGIQFGHPENPGFLEDQAPPPKKSRGPIIRELTSDDEEEEAEGNNPQEKIENPRKHSRADKEPYVQDPDEDFEEKRRRHIQHTESSVGASNMQTQPRTYMFQSSNVTYSGPGGAYYTASTTRRRGGDGVTLEENKEADTTTGRATHRVSRGLHEKGHSVTRKLNSDGRVDTMQTLHNLNEGELSGFDETWKGKARKHLPGWNQGLEMLDNGNMGEGNSSRSNRRGWALPSTEQQQDPRRLGGRRAGNSSSSAGRT